MRVWLFGLFAVWSVECSTLPNGEGDRSTASHGRAKRQGLFSNFASVDHDLEEPYLPNQIAGRLEVIAMAPSFEKDSLQCPHCLSSPPPLLSKLYCSSRLSAKVQFLNKHQLEFMQDLSPGSVSSRIRTRVSYTMKSRCPCQFITQDRKHLTALMVVTPPRRFNLRSIQLMHLDSAITLIPWNTTDEFISSLPKSEKSCLETLIAE